MPTSTLTDWDATNSTFPGKSLPRSPARRGRLAPTPSLRRHSRRARRAQRLVEIAQNVVDALHADRQADIAVGDAGRELLRGAELITAAYGDSAFNWTLSLPPIARRLGSAL